MKRERAGDGECRRWPWDRPLIRFFLSCFLLSLESRDPSFALHERDDCENRHRQRQQAHVRAEQQFAHRRDLALERRDGAHQPVFIYHRKYESIKSNVKFANDAELDSFVIRMAQRAGKHVSIAEPILDATMRDGRRD